MNPENRQAKPVEGRRFALQNYLDSLYIKRKEEGLTALRAENHNVVEDAEKLIHALESEGFLNEEDYVSGNAYLPADVILTSISENMDAYDDGIREDMSVKFGESHNRKLYKELINKYGDVDEDAEESEQRKDEVYIFDKSYEVILELQSMAKLYPQSLQ